MTDLPSAAPPAALPPPEILPAGFLDATPPFKRRFATSRVLVALMLREMSTRYGRSAGGYIWALLEPLGGVLILSLGFSLFIHRPPLGTSFMLFYATGLMPFELFQKVSQATSKALRFSRPLLAYPSVTWLDAIMARFLVNSLTAVTVSGIVMAAIMMAGETHTVLEVWPIMSALAMASLFGLAVGCMNAVLTGFFPTWDAIWSILTRPLFIISGTLMLYESLPGNARDYLWWNPLLQIIGEMRAGFYPMYDADYVNPTYVVLLSLALLTPALLLLRRYHQDLLED